MSEALARPIYVPQATAMVVGTIIGAAIFVQPSEISRFVPHISGTLAVWLLAGLLTFCGALVCAELASALPRTGGVYVFLAESLSPALGFLWGWAMFWTTHSGIIAAIAVVFARYVAYFVPLDEGEIQAVAIAAVVTLSAINYIGVSYGTAVQTAFTVVKVAAIVAILLLVAIFGQAAHQVANQVASQAADQVTGTGVLAAVAANASALESGATAAPGGVDLGSIAGLRELVLALSAGLFAFGGWHMVTYAAGETREAARTIPRALLIGTAVVTLCYLALNAAYLVVLPLERVQHSMHVAADAAEAVGGPLGARAVALLVLISAFGAASGIVLAGPRVYYAMACDGLFFRRMASIHPRFHTPHIAIVAQAIWVSILILTATYRDLYTRVIYTEWIFFGLLAAGLMRLRGRAGYAPRYRVWGYPVVPQVFMAASSLVVVTQVVSDPANSASGLLLVATGLPVYRWWTRGATPPRGRFDARD